MSQHSVAEVVDHSLYCRGSLEPRARLLGLAVPDIDGDDGVGLAILRDSLTGLLAPVEGQIDDGGVTIPVIETIKREGLRSHYMPWPIRSQYLGHVTCFDQFEASFRSRDM